MRKREEESSLLHRADVLKGSLPQGPSAHPRNMDVLSIWGWAEWARRRVHKKQLREAWRSCTRHNLEQRRPSLYWIRLLIGIVSGDCKGMMRAGLGALKMKWALETWPAEIGAKLQEHFRVLLWCSRRYRLHTAEVDFVGCLWGLVSHYTISMPPVLYQIQQKLWNTLRIHFGTSLVCWFE